MKESAKKTGPFPRCVCLSDLVPSFLHFHYAEIFGQRLQTLDEIKFGGHVARSSGFIWTTWGPLTCNQNLGCTSIQTCQLGTTRPVPCLKATEAATF
ncbi:unnamed protein product [Ixodes persulcatus]